MFVDVFSRFVHELRTAGVPVSMVESIDAMRALTEIDVCDREAVRSALGATLVKNTRHHAAFDRAFEAYFSLEPTEDPPASLGTFDGGTPGGSGGGRSTELLAEALRSGDAGLLGALARHAVRSFAGIEPGRPVGGIYYVYRALRAFDLDDAIDHLLDEATASALERRLLRSTFEARAAELRRLVESEVRRRLVADRGRDAVAATLRQVPLEDRDLMHATRLELRDIERVVSPLARKLAARLAERRKRGKAGRLDFRRTVRTSLSTGGVLTDPSFRPRKPTRPDIMLLVDVSGSMATFARFTLQFVYAMSAQFSRLRAFAFVDGLDEVTGFFTPGVDFEDAVARVHDEAEVVWFDGHSDYGHSLEIFRERFFGEMSTKTTLIVAGDARSNYRDPRADLFAEMASVARSAYWLNPEPRHYWNTGDSTMRAYEPFARSFEVRTLRQLERFVERVTSRRSIGIPAANR
jgi:uncharacterized protein with von Willebrand factor type A (vWA) domain